MIFTTKNLIKNIKKLGAWSAYGLAEEALEYYHPSLKRLTGIDLLNKQIYFLHKDGLSTWQDVIVKYHKEVGYKPLNGIFKKESVNEY